MKEMMAYVNGDIVPASQATVSIYDRGLRWGDACYDVERTFGDKPFRLREHLERMYRSFIYTRIRPPMDITALEREVLKVLEINMRGIPGEEDLEVVQIVTRGTMMEPEKPNVIIYTRPLEYDIIWRRLRGVRLITSSTRRMPAASLCPGAKISNKMSFFVADCEVKAVDPDAYPLLLDVDGYVAESSNSNFFFVAGGTLHTPSLENCLPGITRRATIELADELGIPVREGRYTVFDVYNAEEVFLTTTSTCAFHVTHVDGVPIGDGGAGPVTMNLQEKWRELVGIDYVAQARKLSAAK